MLREQIEKYIPFNEQEMRDRQIMLHIIDSCDDYLLRSNETAHFTASAWVVNHDRSKVLLIHHNIYNAWTWTGGHADGEENLLQTALREVPGRNRSCEYKACEQGYLFNRDNNC